MLKITFFTLILVLLNVANLHAQKSVRVFLDSKQYYDPELGNYLEIQLLFSGYTLEYLPVEEGLQGEIAVAMQITQNDSSIVNDVYRLKTPIMRDSVIDDFYDIRRYQLSPGVYQYMLEIFDMNSTSESLTATQTLVIDELGKSVQISDVQVADYAAKGDGTSMFYKSGYDIYPRLNNYFNEESLNLPVYFEIYNTHLSKDSVFGLKQTVINADSGEEFAELSDIFKVKAAPVVPVIRQMSLVNVPAGKYVVEYTLINREQEVVAQTAYSFEREIESATEYLTLENTIIDPAFQASLTNDSVSYYLGSLIPISRPGEVRNILQILKTKTVEDQRKYIQMFWITTAGKSKAYDSWIQYKGQVQLVESVFSTNLMDGYETDRGRVYLQYGAPTQMIPREVSPSEYPYEIWQYDKIGVFSNKRFIFYNPDLINNNYSLLHSDMVGELKNNAWPQALNRRNTTNGNVDDPNSTKQEHFGGQSNSLYR